MLYRNITTL